MQFLPRHCPPSCLFHRWWAWYGEPAKPHLVGITVLGAGLYWGEGRIEGGDLVERDGT
jgi:hypothetical protein